MRITARQLRQIIREELHRGLGEADEVEMGAMEMPAEPKKRGFLDKVFGPSEETLAWNAEWSKLSQGEKDAYVAFVKQDPELPTILGTAVKNKQFNTDKFREFLALPGAVGSGELRRLLGVREKYASRPAFDDRLPRGTGELILPDRRNFAQAISNVSHHFTTKDPQFLNIRAGALRQAAMFPMMEMRPTAFDKVVYYNSYLVAALESFYREDIKINNGRLVEPPEGSPIRKFADAADTPYGG
jgi:hypothetical protein